MYAYWVCDALETPIFSRNFRSGAYHFHKLHKNYPVPEHHPFTFLADFAVPETTQYQNFLILNPFMAYFAVKETIIFKISLIATRSSPPTAGSARTQSVRQRRWFSSRPEHQPDASWQFRRLAFSRIKTDQACSEARISSSKRLKLVPEPHSFTLRPAARSGALAHFSLCRGTYLPNFGVSTPPPPSPGNGVYHVSEQRNVSKRHSLAFLLSLLSCFFCLDSLLSPPNEVSEGNMKRAPYVCVCVCVCVCGPCVRALNFEICFFSVISWPILILFVLSDRTWCGLQNLYTEFWNSLIMQIYANLFKINEKCYFSVISWPILILFVLSDRAWCGLQNFYTEFWNSLIMQIYANLFKINEKCYFSVISWPSLIMFVLSDRAWCDTEFWNSLIMQMYANLFKINEKCYFSVISWPILILFVLSDRAWCGLQNFYTEIWNLLIMQIYANLFKICEKCYFSISWPI